MKNLATLCSVLLFMAACSDNDSTLVIENLPPSISSVADMTVSANKTAAPILISVSDDSTAIADLNVSVSSSNQDLLPLAGVITEASVTGVSLTITPTAAMLGESVIVVTVSDDLGATTSREFLLTVEREVVSYSQFVREVFQEEANGLPRDLNSREFVNDAQDDSFDDVL